MKAQDNDSLVCFCYKRTAQQLVDACKRLGNLEQVQKDLALDHREEIPGATACVKPGMRLMRGMVVASGDIESTIYASNGVPPQFIDCDSTTDLEYAQFDTEGRAVIHRTVTFKTNETFVFDTQKEQLPRPLYGLFLLQLKRANYGASRFDAYWSNGRSTSTTHEIGTTERPERHFPIIVNRQILEGPNRIHLSIQNTYNEDRMNICFRVFDLKDREGITWNCP